jgi:hypothetical protein
VLTRRLAAALAALIVGLAVGLALGIAAPLSDGGKKTVTATVVQTQTVQSRSARTPPTGAGAAPSSRGSRRDGRGTGGQSSKAPASKAKGRRSKQGQGRNRNQGQGGKQGAGTRSLRTFTGRGTMNLGTIRVTGPSVLKWTTRGRSFRIASDALRLNARGHKGSTVVSRGRYRHFRVRTSGKWTLKLERIDVPG